MAKKLLTFNPILDMTSEHQGLVFETHNKSLNEIYVTWTSRPVFRAFEEIVNQLPPAIAHWHPTKEAINFRSLEFGISKKSARAFIARHTAKSISAGWKYIVDPSL